MTESKTANLPIGFWLKKVDQLLTDQINQIQARNGLTRLEWQTLNTLHEKEGVGQEALHTILAPFTDRATLSKILGRFSELDWLDMTNDDAGTSIYRLKSEGKQQHQKVFKAQQEIRELAMKEINAEAYATVIRTLQQMVTNLEATESSVPNR
jgi:DNA-binding MarR family transcriptional regulator